MIGLHESDRGWYDTHRCHYKAIGISRFGNQNLKIMKKTYPPLHLYRGPRVRHSLKQHDFG